MKSTYLYGHSMIHIHNITQESHNLRFPITSVHIVRSAGTRRDRLAIRSSNLQIFKFGMIFAHVCGLSNVVVDDEAGL